MEKQIMLEAQRISLYISYKNRIHNKYTHIFLVKMAKTIL